MNNARTAVEGGTFKDERDIKRARDGIDIDRVGDMIEKYKGELSSFPVPPSVSFCHNDLLSANIMSSPTNQIKLIDFEYGGMNYSCFDIANHFNEFAGGTDDSKPDYSLLPNEEQKTTFIKAYVEAMYKGEKGEEEMEEIVEVMRGQVGVFEQLNHCYWGLWGVNQGNTEGTTEFDYLNYAMARFGQLK